MYATHLSSRTTFHTVPCLQSLPVHIEGHVHIPGAEQFPPLKQPAGHTAL